ncbi:TPA: aldehyde dehydrogenase [Legionella pneumophila]|uniref:aldehyde dehydrogenase family protein n=1 Tax=Legionella sp. PATHC039 TaxID=2992042 RepID=UPI0009B4D647|nr:MULTISPECIES: aldehyde dehydrogenase family protein [Legionella]BCL64423.1 aldehyde dehydrogenase [Legionella pneumophila serogroup 7]HAT8859004.1 aldehyde dehydrogenase family protein [Legionella pneumophila subsp. pneumophila]MCW8395610.1 aldehyde dehydrogenase family protein [Legionella sp. PATHC039]HAT8640929.1 aldehyde dehydrogenase family protein [Legionella pneumophila]HAT8889227.1 aldehyde dehydrogenase family protein [Legionella pneumophila subsp. pneumophila]
MVLPNQVENLINGKWQPSISASWFEKVAPHDGKVLVRVARSTANDTSQAICAAVACKDKWRGLTSVERGNILYKATDTIWNNIEEVAEIVSVETGKSTKDAKSEIMGAIQLGRFFAAEGQRLYGQTLNSGVPNKQAMLVRQPCGVAGLIVSANTPVANFAWKLFPALVCGNTVVLKAPEDAPLTIWKIATLIESLLPAGVLNIVNGFGKECGQRIAESEDIDVLSFTGSTAVGILLAEIAGKNLKKISLELGGKNALVVYKDADIEHALHWALLSSFSNAGQRCASSSRLLVHKDIFEQFKTELIRRTMGLKVGYGDEYDLGPVINEEAVVRLERAIATACSEGGSVLIGGRRKVGCGYYFEPTVLGNLPRESSILNMELFGPVSSLHSFSYFDEMIEMVNDSPYGLTASIHTQNIDVAWQFCEQAKVGTVNVNAGTHGSEPHFPFGGLRWSGNGTREPGLQALDIYSNWKMIGMNIKERCFSTWET